MEALSTNLHGTARFCSGTAHAYTRIARFCDAPLDLDAVFKSNEARGYAQADEILAATGVTGEREWKSLATGNEAVHSLLRIFSANLEAECAAACNCNVLRTDDIGLEVLRRMSAGANLQPVESGKMSLEKILAFEAMPDIPTLIGTGYPAGMVIGMRLDPKVTAFRAFLRSIPDGTPDAEVLRAYYETFKNKTSDRLPVKAARWFINTLLGWATGPLASLGISAADSFFMDRYINGWNPRVFVDRHFKAPKAKKASQSA